METLIGFNLNNENHPNPKSQLPNPLERKKGKGKREKCGGAANRLHDLTV